ncbi:hypothetical protein Y027_5099 [Burkholderia pseudomallei TSV5]|nr:hypothetical protein Y027_5099 [Burkholderia pseudomallei TSV5]
MQGCGLRYSSSWLVSADPLGIKPVENGPVLDVRHEHPNLNQIVARDASSL